MHCYGKIKKETTEMQEAIIKELKLDPVEKEVIVLYEDDNKSQEFWKVSLIINFDTRILDFSNDNIDKFFSYILAIKINI